MKIISTKEVVKSGEYKNSPETFFGGFERFWENTKGQVLKLETRQSYKEPGNKSYEAMAAGHLEVAYNLIEEQRSSDVKHYKSLKERKIDFVRCRPLVFPLSDYMKWEMKVYEFNSKHCERIFCCNYISMSEIFDKFALHDFMVFDARFATIHDYDSDGLIQGGWHIYDVNQIIELIKLFGFIKSNCQEYSLFQY